MDIAKMPTLSVTPARAADGDYKTAGIGHSVKDSDGDYKANAAPRAVPTTVPAGSAVASSSSAVQSALSTLQKGG